MRRLLIALLFVALAAASAVSQVAVISGQVNYNGFPVASAPIRVCSVTSTGTPCVPTTPIYYNYDLAPGHQLPNPTQADQYGNFTIYVPALSAPNLYIVQITPSPGITWSYVYNGAFLSASGGTITGNLIITGNLTVDGTTTSGLFNATTSPYYEVNGTQIACTNLSDCSNLAKLNAANTFSVGPQTAPIFNAVTQFNVNGSQIASANLADAANLAYLNASNTFTGATQTMAAIDATSLLASGNVTGSSLTDTGQATGSGYACLHINSTGAITNTGTECVTATTVYYQTVLLGPTLGSAITQRPYLAVGTGTGLTASDVIGVGSNVSRTVMTVSPVGGGTTLGIDTYVVMTNAGGGNGQFACWDSTSGGISGSSNPCPTGVHIPLTCNVNGCYHKDYDGTITEWVSVPTISSDTGQNLENLPYPIPSSVLSITCTDNSGRVQTGNVQPAGANVVGLSSPFSTFYVSSQALISMYCTVVGE